MSVSNCIGGYIKRHKTSSLVGFALGALVGLNNSNYQYAKDYLCGSIEPSFQACRTAEMRDLWPEYRDAVMRDRQHTVRENMRGASLVFKPGYGIALHLHGDGN